MQDRGPVSPSLGNEDPTSSVGKGEARTDLPVELPLELPLEGAENGNIPPPAWSDATLPTSESAREEHRVPAKQVSVCADPTILPESPRGSRGLLELVSPIARRALELGLLAREPSFHVFVAAEPEVMIEDDIVRYAERFARVRPPPPDIVYVHDFDHPEAPRSLLLPAGVGPTLVSAMDTLVDKLQQEIPNIAHSDTVREAQVHLGRELEARNKAVLTQLESTAKTLGFGIRAVQGGVQTFPILHGKPLSAEQFAALDDSTKRALNEAEERLTKKRPRWCATTVPVISRRATRRFRAPPRSSFARACRRCARGSAITKRSSRRISSGSSERSSRIGKTS